jgi:hypothetical protein
VLAIAVVLDPRYKLCLVKYYYSKIYGDESFENDNVKEKLTKLFMEYKGFYDFKFHSCSAPRRLRLEKGNNIISF